MLLDLRGLLILFLAARSRCKGIAVMRLRDVQPTIRFTSQTGSALRRWHRIALPILCRCFRSFTGALRCSGVCVLAFSAQSGIPTGSFRLGYRQLCATRMGRFLSL